MALEKFIWIMGLLLFASCTPSSKPAPAPSEPAKAAAQNPMSFESLTAQGLSFSAQGKHEEALKAFQQSQILSPRSPLAYNNICSKYNDLKRWQLAIENCKKALELEPGYALAQNNLNFSKQAKAAQDSKIASLEKEIREGKNADRNRVELGMVYYALGEHEHAVESWTPIPETSTLYAMAQNDLASAYILMKNFDLAKISLARALERDPKNSLYLNNQNWLQRASQEPLH